MTGLIVLFKVYAASILWYVTNCRLGRGGGGESYRTPWRYKNWLDQPLNCIINYHANPVCLTSLPQALPPAVVWDTWKDLHAGRTWKDGGSLESRTCKHKVVKDAADTVYCYDKPRLQLSGGGQARLKWIDRLIILKGTCRGLLYLHTAEKSVVHQDIKSWVATGLCG